MSESWDSTWEWTEERVARLKELWLAGLTTAPIAQRLGCSKNAVIGKAHRLGLPKRASPIPRRRVGLKPSVAREAVAQAATDARPCSYPHGEPGQRGFRFCDAPAIEGSSYCEPHHRKTHIKGKPYEPRARRRW